MEKKYTQQRSLDAYFTANSKRKDPSPELPDEPWLKKQKSTEIVVTPPNQLITPPAKPQHEKSDYSHTYSKLGFNSEPLKRSSSITITPSPPRLLKRSSTMLTPSKTDTESALPTTPLTAAEKPISETAEKSETAEPTTVLFPFDKSNTYFCRKTKNNVNKWNLIQHVLSQTISSVSELQDAILEYNPQHKGKWSFNALNDFFAKCATMSEIKSFFTFVLPGMQILALKLKTLFEDSSIPLLVPQKQQTVLLSQEQIACLLANAFFCTFPKRNWSKNEYGNYPTINFNSLFAGGCTGSRPGKFRCIINYFNRVLSKMPEGSVSFHRRCIDTFPKWKLSKSPISPVKVLSKGTIEDAKDEQNVKNILEVDFANKLIGGGVLSSGCVQEEIRFLINTELLITRLFTATLQDNECVIITGAERYCTYKGYSDSFEFVSDYKDETPKDKHGRRDIKIVAIDALNFYDEKDQYSMKNIDRELNKAYTGFVSPSTPFPIATGNWGCGAFKGNPQLKAIIQLMVVADVGREMYYFTWGDETLAENFSTLVEILGNHKVTVGNLYNALELFCDVYKTDSKASLFVWLLNHFTNKET